MKKELFTLLAFLAPVFSWAQVSIGDILCTDGSIIKAEQYASSGKTAEGIVFYVDASDARGWAVALENQSSSIKWCSEELYGYDLPDLTNYENARAAMHDLDGQANTGILRSQGNRIDFPAAWSVDYSHGWYLPSAGQLRYLYSLSPEINTSLQVVGGTALPYHSNNYWWSSTEHTGYHAFDMNTGGSLGDYVKDNYVNYPPSGIGVRQIKDFTLPHPTHPEYHVGDLITNDDGSKGILFYVNADQTEGWIVALNDVSSSIPWGNNGDVPSLTNQTCATPYGALLDETDGFANTASLRAYQTGMNTAANAVDYPHGWYLPTAGQLSKLFGALPFIEDKLQAYGSSFAEDYYWSSSEANASNAFALSFRPEANVRAGHFVRSDKSLNFRVRAIRNLHFETPPPDPTLPDNILEDDCNTPFEGHAWDIKLLYSNANNNVATYAPILAGDINDDGIVDIVTAQYTVSNYYSFWINVHRGDNLNLQYRFSIPDTLYTTNGPYAIGKYPLPDGTKQGAIFIHCNDKMIRSFAIDGTLLGVSDRPTTCDGMVALADFNGDGYPEVYAGSDIYDAATMKWLCSGPADGNKGLGFRGLPFYTFYATHHTYYAMSLVYDILGDLKQELICGNTIYDVNIVSRTNPALNSITVNKTITPPSGFPQDGHITLADLDLDGECEVLVIRDNTHAQIVDDTYFYAYKPSNGQILFQKAINCESTGYVTVGNIDDDPHPEMIFLENQPNGTTENIICWRYTIQNGFETVWAQPHDDRSGQTGITLFDFNQDGIMEIVYRDNRNLRILNASGKSHITGNDTIRPYNVFARQMSAGTGNEYPIVADVNGDGYAEIVATGLLDTPYNGQDLGYGGLHVFGNPDGWSPARPVWNQYMYHVTNVNEDLTIPTSCFNKATVFTAPDGTIRRPYNNFLQQAYYITPYGEPYHPGEIVEIEHYGEGCESYTFHGVTYTESGDYEYQIENPLGCDTLLTVHVQIGDTIHTAQYQSVCSPYTWNGVTYEQSGIYEQAFTSAQGCDSIVTLYLNIGDQIFTHITVSTCDSYTWNGITYNTSGTYDQTFTSAQGCDSIVILDLTIKASTHVGQIHGETLIYYQTTGDYTYSIDPVEGCFGYDWTIDGPWTLTASPDSPECTLNINVAGTGTLKVRVYTECGYIERTLFINHDAQPDVVVYPNPTQGEFNIVLSGMEGEAVITIYDYLGQCIGHFSVDTELQGSVVPYSLAGKAAGVYLIAVTNHFRWVTKKVIKDTASSYGIYNWDW